MAGDCFGKLRPALERGGYGAGLDCRDVDVRITYVGRTKPRHGPSYIVYNLYYETKHDPGRYPHVGNRILIFDSHLRYLGHYHLEGPVRARIAGTDVLIDAPAAEGNRIHLGRASPPDPEWVQGDRVGFDR